MHLPDFRGYVMTTQAPFPEGRSADGKQTPALSISNHNTLFLNYPGAIGIKNGYTKAGEDGYIEAATRVGKTNPLTEMSSPRVTGSQPWRCWAGRSPMAPHSPRSASGSSPALDPPPSQPLRQLGAPLPATTTSALEAADQPMLRAWIGLVGGISALAMAGA